MAATERKQRFVPLAERVRLELTEGDWIDVRSDLSYGQQMRLLEAARKTLGGETTEGEVNWMTYRLEEILAWVTAWSFVEEDGLTPVPIARQQVEALTQDTAAELYRAIEQHKDQKKVLSTPTATSSAPA